LAINFKHFNDTFDLKYFSPCWNFPWDLEIEPLCAEFSDLRNKLQPWKVTSINMKFCNLEKKIKIIKVTILQVNLKFMFLISRSIVSSFS
jgi:hypothetical protein